MIRTTMYGSEELFQKHALEGTWQSSQVRKEHGADRQTQTDLMDDEVTTPGNGHDGNIGSGNIVWELSTLTSTFQPHSMEEAAGIQAELVETKIRLSQAKEKNIELQKKLNDWLSNRFSMEAEAASSENAINILVRMSGSESLKIEKLLEDMKTSEQWLSLVKLAQAGLIKFMGSYLYLTDYGKRTLDLFLE